MIIDRGIPRSVRFRQPFLRGPLSSLINVYFIIIIAEDVKGDDTDDTVNYTLRIASPFLYDAQRVHLSCFGCRRCGRETIAACLVPPCERAVTFSGARGARSRGVRERESERWDSLQNKTRAWRSDVKDGSDGHDYELASEENTQQLRGRRGTKALSEDRLRVQILQVSA